MTRIDLPVLFKTFFVIQANEVRIIITKTKTVLFHYKPIVAESEDDCSSCEGNYS